MRIVYTWLISNSRNRHLAITMQSFKFYWTVHKHIAINFLSEFQAKQMLEVLKKSKPDFIGECSSKYLNGDCHVLKSEGIEPRGTEYSNDT